MCVFPWGDELCRKAGSHQHWLPPRRAETSTSSLRTTCGSFVHGAGSELQVHAGQTRLRTLQLSCWPCDATAELRDSAEAGDIDKGHAPKSYGSGVRDATEVQLYPKKHTVSAFVHLAHSLGKLETSRARSLLQLRSMGRLVQCPALRPSKVASSLTETTIHFEVQQCPSEDPSPAKAADSLAQPCVSCCPCGSLGWRG